VALLAPPAAARAPAFFDRSWYGRVLVERVEGFCAEADWMRAYGEINEFEHALVQHGVVLAKFWLAISKDEQYRRFKQREAGRVQALQDHRRGLAQPREVGRLRGRGVRHGRPHVHRTTPWTLVEANNKYHARIKVLRTLCEAVEAGARGHAGRQAARIKVSKAARSPAPRRANRANAAKG
jgi:hypothetical protein